MSEEVNEQLNNLAAAEGQWFQPMTYVEQVEAIAQHSVELASPGLDGLKNSLKAVGIKETVVFEDNTFVQPEHGCSAARKEIQAVENMQIKKRKQYEADRAFFEQNVLKKSRSIGEIQEDYVKILHPHYREKFLTGIEKYGTVAAALKYMKDNYGLKVRSDLLERMKIMIPAFKTEIDDALAMYQGTIQMAIHQRAVEGVDKIIRDRDGNEIDREKVYSDALLVKLADTHTPEYKEAKQKDNQRGNTINVQIIKDFHNYKDK